MDWRQFFKKHLRIFLQLSLLIAIAVIFAFFGKWLAFRSALFGGGAWIIPDLYFFQRQQSIQATHDVRQMFKIFFLGELFKLLLSFIIIILVLLICAISSKAFLSSYIAMILISFAVPFRRGTKNV